MAKTDVKNKTRTMGPGAGMAPVEKAKDVKGTTKNLVNEY